MQCYVAYSNIPMLYANGSTGGVASTLAYYLLVQQYVKGVLVSKRYETFIARSLDELQVAQGSIYEHFPYTMPNAVDQLAQIGKPCNINRNFRYIICLFCSSLFATMQHPISKRELRSKSSIARYLMSLFNKPYECRRCQDHIGQTADISVGDSQHHEKHNHVILWTAKGQTIFHDAIQQQYISAKEIPFELIENTQPYLFSKLRMVKRWITP